MRTVNKDNKKNIKCEYCKHWDRKDKKNIIRAMCKKKKEEKNYWNRCKNFNWRI